MTNLYVTNHPAYQHPNLPQALSYVMTIRYSLDLPGGGRMLEIPEIELHIKEHLEK